MLSYQTVPTFSQKSISVFHFEYVICLVCIVEDGMCLESKIHTHTHKWPMLLSPNLNNLSIKISIVVNNTKSIKGVQNWFVIWTM